MRLTSVRRACLATGLLLGLSLPATASAQEPPEPRAPQTPQAPIEQHPETGALLLSDFSRTASDAGNFFSAPVRFSTEDWLLAGAAVGATAALFTADESIRSFALRNQSNFGNTLSDVGREYGRELYGLTLSGGLYAGGLLFREDRLRETGLMLFESIAFAGITTTVVKSLVGRSRPFDGEGPTRFHFLQFNLENTSLPSGHATVAFAVSSLLAGRIGNPYAAGALYAMAALTAASRVYSDDHWFSDTLLGAVIGTASGLYVNSRHSEGEAVRRVRIVPGLGCIRAEIIL